MNNILLLLGMIFLLTLYLPEVVRQETELLLNFHLLLDVGSMEEYHSIDYLEPLVLLFLLYHGVD